MKKLLLTLAFTTTLFSASFIHAQYCGSSSPSECTPAGALAQPGFQHPDSLPCAVQGVSYDEAIQIKMYDLFTFGGNNNVDSIEFLKIDSLPCGLCWSTNKTTNRFKANEYGCIRIVGTTNDAAGQYKLSLNLRAWINNQTIGIPVGPSLVDGAGIKLFVRVQSSSGTCSSVDTSAGAMNLNPTPALCANSVNDLSNDITDLNIFPNPLNAASVISFNSAKGEQYTLRITDVTGKLISERMISTKPGVHRESIGSGNLSAGVYFVSLSNGRDALTKRVSVVQ